MDDFYRELIVEHYKNPAYKGTLDPNDFTYEDENPLCGDHIRVDLRVDEKQIITEAVFSGHGCAISQASADLLMESIIGKPLDEVKNMTKETVLELLGIQLGPVRLKCALLSLKVLKAGLYGIGNIEEELLEI
ncbi:MAG: SUF system NifU family Fe-S cluster assembly protein [Chloroflexi bacterium HGW-Chloroflexi-2]|jgi:nitrogen fixation NifU-like protein|nr:MAG: SUF system NifU family Fe-S cluster assembly protein [Chloroflexi bacterium HGW-Chloroflexi-2]